MRRYQDIANNEAYADNNSPDFVLMQNEEEPANNTEKKNWPKVIIPLIDLASEKPQVWKVLKIKIYNPEMSSREIAKKTGLAHITVQRHLKEAEKVLPGLEPRKTRRGD